MPHLSSVRIRGFKTFARPTELAFRPGITVVIGPNGSGKSNIADAVLWVLGEQSPASLRGRSMQDVLFTGPDGRKSSVAAEVSLTFEDGDGMPPLDSTQVEITRRLERDGTSEYRINGSACRLLDVHDLMAGLGLGREMHSVISQGRVEALLNSSPETKRALVEEVAGLGRFKKRRERAQAKLDRTAQNLLRVSDVEAEVKKSLRPLRQQAAAAERFAQATEEWAAARARLVVFDLARCTETVREIGEALGRSASQKTEVEEELAALRSRRVEQEERFTAALREREDLNTAYHLVRVEGERLDSRCVALRQRLARQEGDMNRARRRKELAEGELAAYEARLREAGADSTDKNRLEWIVGVASDVRSRLEAITATYREMQLREEGLKDEVFELETARSRALQERERLRKDLEEKKRLVDAIHGLSRAAAAKAEELELEARSGGEEISRAEQLLARTREDLTLALKWREEARAREDEARREEAALAEVSAGLDSRSAILLSMLHRREGIPSGALEIANDVEGSRLLTEVISVEPGYERALAAALGLVVRAVVLTGAPDPSAALRGEGPREVIWGLGTDGDGPVAYKDPPASGGHPAAEPLPTGLREIWDLVRGPEPVIRTLRTLVPPTAVLMEDMTLDHTDMSLPAGIWRVVTRSGEVMTAGVHVARRTEEAAEALLRAGNELAEVEAERSRVPVVMEEAKASAQAAATQVREAESAYKASEEELRRIERCVLTAKNDADIRTRRIEEAHAQVKELAERHAGESASIEALGQELGRMEALILDREAELSRTRMSLGGVQPELESLRRTVNHLEEKKSQAALLEVRLRERCRARDGERGRIKSQRDAAALDHAKMVRRLKSIAEYMPHLAALLDVVERLVDLTGRVSREAEAALAAARSRSECAAGAIRDWAGLEAELLNRLEGVTSAQVGLQVERARADDRRAALESELSELRRRHMAPRSVTFEDVAGESREVLESVLCRAEQRRERIGTVNPLAEQECAEMEERARFFGEQRRDLEASMARLRDMISELDEHINKSFDGVFAGVQRNFASVVATVFPGAKGMLTLTERSPSRGRPTAQQAGQEEDGAEGEAAAEPSRGISMIVKFPNKAPRSMSLLSGGEKAMTAIAFLFSLFLARPCPFYILDEVEASLDDVNIKRFLSLIRRYRDKTQFVVITHQRQTMEVADTLYGVALEPDGTSRVFSRRWGEDGSARAVTPGARGRSG